MKTRPTITPVTDAVPRRACAMARQPATLNHMKQKLKIWAFALCSALTVTSAFGQSQIWTWTNNSPADLGSASSWTNSTVPTNGIPESTAYGSGVVGDTMLFDGRSVGTVNAFSTLNTPLETGSSVGGTIAGIWLHVTANQTSPVRLYTTVANSASSGVRFNNLTVDAGAGQLIMGSGSTTNSFDTVWGTTNPSGQGLTNNSTTPAIINLDMRWRMGAGGAHTMVFAGTGDWIVTNDIANVNGAASLIQKDGTGTLYWTAGHNSFWGVETVISSPMTLSGGGTIMLQSGGLFPSTTTINNNGNALILNAPPNSQAGGAQSIGNAVNGTGNIAVYQGTLTLSGPNTYTGNTILQGGELIVNRAENLGVNGPLGNGGLISFTGGTLGYSVNNTYDYSPRFSNAVNQAISIDTGSQNVTLTNNLTSSGGSLTKLSPGTLTLAGANSYTGNTMVGAGKLVIQGTQGAGNIIVSNSAAMGVTAPNTISPAALNVGTTSFGTLEFNNVSSTSTPLITAGTINATTPIVLNINSGTFNTIGQVFPLMSWSSGNPPPTVLGTVTGAGGTISTNLITKTINFTVTSLAFIWTGNNNDGLWDTVVPNDWKLNGNPVSFQNGGTALLDDTATGAAPLVTNLTVDATITPSGVTINDAAKPYTISSDGTHFISGSGGLTKSGNSSLTLAGGLNTFTGPTIINGGVVSVGALANGGTASDIGEAGNGAANLVFNGGTLQYNNTGTPATSDHLFTVTTAGGTIDDEGTQLTFNNTGNIVMSGSGARTFNLTGVDASGDTLAAVISDNGGATALTKTGAGEWILTGLNTFSGNVTIGGGTLQVGTGGSSALGTGSVLDDGVLIYNVSGTITNTAVSGTGSLDLEGPGTVVLSGNSSYSGGTTINNGTLQVGTGGATGQLNPNAALADNGLLIFNTSGTFAYGGNGITGGGNVIVTGGGKITDVGPNSYSGWTLITPGSTFEPCQGNSGALASSVVTNNGTLLLIRQDNGVFIYAGPITGSGSLLVDANNFNPGDVTLTGNCDYRGGTFIGDNGLIIDNGSGTGWITNNVTFINSTQVPNDNARTLTFDRPDNVTFPGNITTNFTSSQNNLGVVVQSGTGILTLTGTNTYGSGTTINAGAIQVGNGGTRGTIGSGPVTDTGTLIWDRSDNVSFNRVISGAGTLVQFGSGTLSLSASNTYTGATSVSNGTLSVVSVAGDLDMNPGTTLVAGPVGAAGTLAVGGALNLGSAALSVTLNKSLALSNSVVSAVGGINASGAALKVANVGPALRKGDQFYIFGAPVSGFTSITAPPSVTISNGLALDGSITILSATATNPTNITATISGSNLNLSWPADHTGWRLQVQTNTLATGLNPIASAWSTVPGSTSVNSVSIPLSSSGAVFYRMVYP